MNEFKYLGVLFTSEGKIEHDINRQIGAVSAVMIHAQDYCGKEGAESQDKVFNFTNQTIFRPSAIGHELWIVTERSFLCSVARLSLKDKVESSDIQRELMEEPLLLCLEKSQLMWSVHLIILPPFDEGFTGTSNRYFGFIRTQQRDHICLHIHMWPGNEKVAEENDIWATLMNLLPP